MSEQSLMNLGDLSKPATKLIEKISDAIGGIFKPYQIVRVAKADAAAEQIRADSKIVVQDIHRRAMHRFLEEEAKKQKNIEDITQRALPNLKSDAKSENIENDWITNFFDKCRLISDTEMQNLWSRILSGEANSPGSYSKRTVNFLSSLDKDDAELFTNLCKFEWNLGGAIPLIYDHQNEIYNKHNINFNTLNHLESIGLIQFNSISGYRHIELPQLVSFSYYGQVVEVEFPKETNNQMDIGLVLLTSVGEELAPICGPSLEKEFFEYICDKWKKEGLIKNNTAAQDDEVDEEKPSD